MNGSAGDEDIGDAFGTFNVLFSEERGSFTIEFFIKCHKNFELMANWWKKEYYKVINPQVAPVLEWN